MEIINKDDHVYHFCSYFKQIQEVMNLQPKSVLDIGVEDKVVSNYLKEQRIYTKTFDNTKEINPDYLGDIRNIEKIVKEKFDVVLCAEVLEHIPWLDFEMTLEKLSKLGKYVIITLPHLSFNIRFSLKISRIRQKNLNIYIPIFRNNRIVNTTGREQDTHYWEIGNRGFSQKSILKILEKYFTIERHYRLTENPYHHFFILKSKSFSRKWKW